MTLGTAPRPSVLKDILQFCSVIPGKNWNFSYELGSVVTRIRAGLRIQDLTPGRDNNFSLLHNIHTRSESHPTSYTTENGTLSKVKWPGAKLTIHLHLVPRLRIRGALLRVLFNNDADC